MLNPFLHIPVKSWDKDENGLDFGLVGQFRVGNLKDKIFNLSACENLNSINGYKFKFY